MKKYNQEELLLLISLERQCLRNISQKLKNETNPKRRQKLINDIKQGW